MKKLLLSLLSCVLFLTLFAEENKFSLIGRVKESFGKTDLTNAYVLTLDSLGNVSDSIRTNQGRAWRFGRVDTTSVFFLNVPRVDSTYVFDVVCEGYMPVTVTYTVDKIGKRETTREMPSIYLDRAPTMLNEVTVTSSKIKFYQNGDTIVYNADAFRLAEGSMLDALISQLPGVELNSNGQIKVNGEFVESLLLNGKQFFDGNNNLMLENIAAYTVKDIQIFEGVSKRDAFEGNDTKKVLTMDVRLKKEYNIGWIINSQLGYGTENRYLGKLLASWFNPTTRLSLLGNVNNLNSNRTPGRDDTWTPDQMPDGKKNWVMGGLNYNYEHPEGKKFAEGNVMFTQSINNVSTTTARTNFLPGGDIYENSFSNSHDRVTGLSTDHYWSAKLSELVRVGITADANYTYGKNVSADISGAFDKDPGDITREMLEAIYSNASPEQLESVLNRARTRTDGWSKDYNVSGGPYVNIALPKSNDRIILRADVAYRASKEELWRDYDINYGPTYVDPQILRQYTDNSPNHELLLNGMMRYSTMFDKVNFSFTYNYTFSEEKKDSYFYALDRLNDMGIYGTVPSDYLLALDPANSFASTTHINKHSFNPSLSYYTSFRNKSRLILYIQPQVSINHRKLDYFRNGVDYRLSKTYAQVIATGIWSMMAEYNFNVKTDNGQPHLRNSVRYSYSINPTLPEMVDMLDIVNDTDPLNIYLGNTSLKMAYRHRHLFRWQYSPHSYPTFMNVLYLSYTHASNSLTRGYIYNTSNGVRYNRMYNVDGNRTWAATNELSWQFGSKKQFTLSSNTDGILATYNDMIGIDMEAPRKQSVQTNTLTENLRMAWQIGSQTLSLRCDVTARRTTSDQPGFTPINATHVNYGLSGTFVLPGGFGINTDFMCYTRRGYGFDYLDTTDAVWNLRLSYSPPRNKHWVFMADGFDILHQLSNVNYSVTASGRTVSFTNTIPRYFMLSAQYRLNIQPKKR